MPTDPLEPLLEGDDIDPSRIGRAELAAIHGRVSTTPADEFLWASARAPGLSWDGPDRPEGFFEIHNRRWWINATLPHNRQYLLTLVAAAAIIDALRLDLGIGWVAQVLPTVLSVESIRIDESGLHLTVRRDAAPALPDDLAEDINPQDFADFVGAVGTTAPAVPLPAGGTVTFTRRRAHR
jgi:hypothetical protein